MKHKWIATMTMGISLLCPCVTYAFSIRYSEDYTTITFYIDGDYAINVGYYVDHNIRRIVFTGPYKSCSLERVTFDGLEEAGCPLKIDLRQACVVNEKNFEAAQEAYRVRHGQVPIMVKVAPKAKKDCCSSED